MSVSPASEPRQYGPSVSLVSESCHGVRSVSLVMERRLWFGPVSPMQLQFKTNRYSSTYAHRAHASNTKQTPPNPPKTCAAQLPMSAQTHFTNVKKHFLSKNLITRHNKNIWSVWSEIDVRQQHWAGFASYRTSSSAESTASNPTGVRYTIQPMPTSLATAAHYWAVRLCLRKEHRGIYRWL